MLMIVCKGNICRSPMAEVVLRERFARAGLGDEVHVSSAGTTGEETGKQPDCGANAILIEAGYPDLQHQARQVTAPDILRQDLVLAMTVEGVEWLQRQAPTEESARRVALFRSFGAAEGGDGEGFANHLKAGGALDVPDPVHGDLDSFREALQQIESAADPIVRNVRERIGR